MVGGGGGNPEIVKGVGGGSGAGIFGGVVYESEYMAPIDFGTLLDGGTIEGGGNKDFEDMAQIDFGTFAWTEEWKKGAERIPSAWLRWTIGSLLDGRMENLQDSR